MKKVRRRKMKDGKTQIIKCGVQRELQKEKEDNERKMKDRGR